MQPRVLYLHGFASSPRSAKAMAFADHFARRGIELERLDQRVPSLPHLRLSAMIAAVEHAIGGPRDRAVVLGSSLGGLTAARVAERDPRVTALVLLAPAFELIARWRQLPGWDDWQRLGWREIFDFDTRQPARIDFAAAEDVMAVDVGTPDVRVPTLIVHGTHDEVVPIELSRTFARGRRHVRLVELDDGHDLLASLPRMFDEVDRFLAPWLGA
ncbi:MAG TPA: YqiA/YcfP family alpha/beta fold hydrolase [Kofleriaceae bacterium]|nr:YqiA/YcfP family alpha/beta fold hydrolase [Kofleriaceae bacterium]